MSYATSLLAAYPSSYGPSTLLSDDLVGRSPFDNLYPSSVPYMSSGRLLSDDIAFNQITHDTSTYRPPLYSISNSTSVYPTNNYQTNWHKPMPSNDSFALSNDITEYSDSLATASNTNTASSVARSINGYTMSGPMNMFSNHQQNYNPIVNDFNNNNNSQQQSMWNSPQTKKKGQTNDVKPKSTLKQQPQSTKTRTQPSTVAQKKPVDDDLTPVQSPRAPLTKQQNGTINQIEKQPSSVDIQAWLNDTKKDSPIDDAAAEQAWSVKIGQLHMTQAQREKEKAKSSRALPNPPKKVDNKPIGSKTKPINDTKSRDPNYQIQQDSYFDSLFDGDYFRNDYAGNSSYHQPLSTKPKLSNNSLSIPNSTNVSKNPKYAPQRKTPRYEPPTPKRAPPAITTTSWRKQLPRQYNYDSVYPYYVHDEFTHRDLAHKDTDERFREALHKLRADRAEQQHKDINEKTAKRLNYGDYVRHSTKDALLQNAVKPSPWSDFMDLKKGNIYSLSKEEKRRLYNQSKSYGERVRYRNFAIHHENETARSHRHSVPLPGDSEESDSGQVTPRQTMHNGGPKSLSRTSKRPGSGSTVKSTKQADIRHGNRSYPNQTSRTTVRTSRSNHTSEDEDGTKSESDVNRRHKQPIKKKNVRYAKYDSYGRTTDGTEESENDNHSQRSTRVRNRDTNDDLFTVREEKTLESIEGVRYKKR